MPPRKVKNKKSREDAEAKAAADDPNDASRAETMALRVEADRLHKHTQKEERDFNEYQQQREKLTYFWIVEKKKLEDKKAELRNKERELQDLEERHQVEIKIYKQRLKHLLHEHQDEITQKKIEAETALKMAQDDFRLDEIDIKSDRRIVNSGIKVMELSQLEYIRSLKREQDQKITMLRHEFERRATEIQRMYEDKMKHTQETLEEQRREALKIIEERKNVHIEGLLAEHQKAFTDIRNYYNDITHNNLDLIKSLKEEVKELEAEERKDELRLADRVQENKKLSAPLKKMQQDKIRLEEELEQYTVEKEELLRVKAALVVVEDRHRALHWENEVLDQRHFHLQCQAQELKDRYTQSLFDVKQKSGFRGLLLEKRLRVLCDAQEEREAQLSEVLARANLEPSLLGQVRGKVENVLSRKTQQMRQLQAAADRLKAKQQQLVEAVFAKLQEFGIPREELGFEPRVDSNPNPGSRVTSNPSLRLASRVAA